MNIETLSTEKTQKILDLLESGHLYVNQPEYFSFDYCEVKDQVTGSGWIDCMVGDSGIELSGLYDATYDEETGEVQLSLLHFAGGTEYNKDLPQWWSEPEIEAEIFDQVMEEVQDTLRELAEEALKEGRADALAEAS